MLSIIAAVGNNRVIGNKNTIPWHIPRDFAYFKKTTLGHPIVMGQKTFESIGRALPGRTNIVLSLEPKTLEGKGVVTTNNFDEAMDIASKSEGGEEVFIIGGGSVYSFTIEKAGKLYITEVKGDFEGDIFFPEIDKNIWRETSREFAPKDDKNSHDIYFVTYERNAKK